MSYNHGKEERRWKRWKLAEEKVLRACSMDENTIEQLRLWDRPDRALTISKPFFQ